MLNEVVDEIIGDGQKVTAIRLKNVVTGEFSEHPCDGVFLAIGHAPNSALFKDQLDMDDYGYIKTEFANTLQALKNHQKINVLDNVGEADITALVDFSLLEKIGKCINSTRIFAKKRCTFRQFSRCFAKKNKNV